MRFLAAFSVVLLASCALGISTFSVELKKVTRDLGSRIDAGDARAALQKSCGRTTVPVTNSARLYTASIGIGNPPTHYNLGIETTSANIWCGLQRPYRWTPTKIPTGENVSVDYGTASFEGEEYLDRVAVAPNIAITNQSVGDQASSEGFQPYHVDGIMGLGPVGLSVGTLSPDVNESVPTVMNNLVSQGLIEKQILGVYFAPSCSDNDENGLLTFGGIDTSRFIGELSYTPVTTTAPASIYWGVNLTSLTYGGRAIISQSTAGIIGSASPISLAGEFFDIYMGAIPGATYNATTLLLEIPEASISSMQPLYFEIGERVYILDVDAQLIPQSENTAWGGQPGKRYGSINNFDPFSGPGMGFVLGVQFMERFYTVFDAESNRVGFAETEHTFSPGY